MPLPIIILIVLALVYGFINGFLDSGSLVATMISSRAIAPRTALTIIASAAFIGPFIFGVAVAQTIGGSLVSPESVTLSVVYAALGSSIVWSLITWRLGIPSSSSHALFGGILGAAVVQAGFGVVQNEGLIKILISLFLSPVIGLVAGYLLMKLVLFLARNATPRINIFFKRFQVVNGIVLGLTHGGNNTQKTMGIVTLGLVTAGYLDTFRVPLWVTLISSLALSAGSFIGGWRLIRTLGGKLYKIRPVHAFTSQIASAAVILSAIVLGGPVSATHVVSSSIMGAGAAERVSKVRWPVVGEIGQAWLLTIPVSALLAALFFLFFHHVLNLDNILH